MPHLTGEINKNSKEIHQVSLKSSRRKFFNLIHTQIMNKKVKSVSMLLFLAGLSTGIAYADQPKEKLEFDIVQQATTCQGIVKDATGESIIGASVVVKGTTHH